MGERLAKFWGWIKKEFSSWAAKGLFNFLLGLGIVGISWVFLHMTWYEFLILVFCVTLTIYSGVRIVKNAIRDIRKSSSRKQDAARAEELRRRKLIRDYFQKFIAEAEQDNDWTDRQLSEWVSRIEHAMYPLMENEVEPFLKLFGKREWIQPVGSGMFVPTVAEKRQQCVAWLKAMLLKY